MAYRKRFVPRFSIVSRAEGKGVHSRLPRQLCIAHLGRKRRRFDRRADHDSKISGGAQRGVWIRAKNKRLTTVYITHGHP